MSANVVELHIANWDKDKEAISMIRREVFIKEQQVPEDMEWDDMDDCSTHLLITVDEHPVATARLTPDGQVGRMSVLKKYRNRGLGQMMLDYLIQHYGTDNRLFLHAQKHALEFYRKTGFVVHGDEYMEAGIPHVTMVMNKQTS